MTKKTLLLTLLLILVAGGIFYFRYQINNQRSSVAPTTSESQSLDSQNDIEAEDAGIPTTINYAAHESCNTAGDCIPVSEPGQARADGTPVELVQCYRESILADCPTCKKDTETMENPNLASCACVKNKCDLQVH